MSVLIVHSYGEQLKENFQNKVFRNDKTKVQKYIYDQLRIRKVELPFFSSFKNKKIFHFELYLDENLYFKMQLECILIK